MCRTPFLIAVILACIPVFSFAQEDASKKIVASLSSTKARILFEAYDQNNWEIYSSAADGTDVKNLTNSSDEHEMYPQASPDGKMICYQRDEAKNDSTIRSVYVMNRDGTNRKKISDQARQPCWSPDSKKIAFTKMEFGKFNIKDFASKGLFIYDIESGKIRTAGNKKVHHIYVPNWSPDGKWIITTVHGGMGFKHAIIACEVDGDRVIDLKVSGCRPCVSADGKKLTWSCNDHCVSVADLTFDDDTVKVTNERTVHEEKKLHLYHPDFSPDGKFIVFSIGPGGRTLKNGPGTHTQVAEMIGVRGKWNLVVKRSDGSGSLHFLNRNPDSTTKEADWIVEK